MHPIFLWIPMVISVILACLFEDTSKICIPAWLSAFITIILFLTGAIGVGNANYVITNDVIDTVELIPMNDDTYNMSFSGLKSAIINLVHNETQRGNKIRKEDLARSFQDVAVDQLCRKTELALKQYDVKHMIIAGGVSANSFLREEIKKVTDKYGVDLCVPRLLYCTDNAAMIGAAAYPLYLNGEFADLSLNATSTDEIY